MSSLFDLPFEMPPEDDPAPAPKEPSVAPKSNKPCGPVPHKHCP